MEKSKNILLLGNGLNRAMSQGYSWEDLIIKLIKRFSDGKVNHDADHPKPFPLLYEEILSYALTHRKGDENSIKLFIKEEITNIKPNQHQIPLNWEPFTDILTTNYDENIEQAIGNDAQFNLQAPVDEQKYSLFRKKAANGISQAVWHLHGEATKPYTTTLGYEHYAGYLQNIRESVIIGNKYKNFTLKNLRERLNTNMAYRTWIDFFFTHNVHIVGLSLDFSEIDLWWLLVYRSRMMNRRTPENQKKAFKIRNLIFYYHPSSSKSVGADKNKLELLESLGVKPVPGILIGDNWEEYYHNLFTNNLNI